MKFLELPEHLRPRKYKVRSPSLYYGAGQTLQQYLGLQLTPWGVNGFWQHGPITPWRMTHPNLVSMSTSEMSEKSLYLVARRDESAYLRSEGFRAEAIGLPIAYALKPLARRISDSILVMPTHSTKNTKVTDTGWTIAYARFVESLKGRFSKITVCLHSECLATPTAWAALKALPVEFVVGASVNDASSLERMAWLFSTFEYVTSNGYGSHIPYAAAFGAKPSVCGPNRYLSALELRDEPFYIANPELLEGVGKQIEVELADNAPFLIMSSPEGASCHREWGDYLIGSENRRDKSELIDMLRLRWFQKYGPMQSMPRYAIGKCWRIASNLPRSVSVRIK